MNLVGVHGSVFVATLEPVDVTRAAELTRQAGFDLLELPLMDPDALDVAATRRALADHELAATASLGLDFADDLSSEDADASARGERRLTRALEVVADVGGTHLCGVLAGAMGKHAAPIADAGRARSVAALHRVGERATELGVSIAVEVVNRYESNLFNTAADGLRLLADVDSPSVGLLLDSYHMNIEETDLRTPLLAAGSRLGYVHAGESHRGQLGTGTADFAALFDGVAQAGFSGPVVFESFSSSVVNAQYASMLAIWRDLWSDPLPLATRAAAFIRDGLARAQAPGGRWDR